MSVPTVPAVPANPAAPAGRARPVRALRSTLPAFLAGLAVAWVLVAVVYGLARRAGDPLLVAPPGQAAQEVTLQVALLAATVGALGGLVLALVARRFAPRPRATFLVVALAGLLLSFGPAIGAAGGGTRFWLVAMHLAVAAGVLPALARTLPGRSG